MYSFEPRHYHLHFEPDFDRSTFHGHTTITGKCTRKNTRISLDARDLSIDSVVLLGGGPDGTDLSLEYSTDEENQSLTVVLPRELDSELSLAIDYTGRIQNDLAGLYRASFTEDGRTRVMAITQFEEIDARRAFPCVDRPAAKARFDVEYLLPNGIEGIANTPAIEDRALEPAGNGENTHLVRFETTPLMSTYLLFFGMGPFEFEVNRDWRIPVRVAARPGQARYGKEAIQWTKEALRFGEEYTEIPFPIAKMDLIACPDFAFGAMENYGAITFRENRLLIYPGRTPAPEYERVCQITNHEVAHMWFGNLVTPKDWSYIWLNEAFATYFGYVITDTFHPEFDGLDQFIASQMDAALSRDGLQSTVPIEFPDGRELEFSPATTPIIYRKAGCILRMMRLYLGDCGIAEARDGDATEGEVSAPFRDGVRAFLHDFRESSADTDGFLASFARGVQENPSSPHFSSELFEGWLRTPGYPIISADRSENTLYLSARRFLYLNQGSAGRPDASDEGEPMVPQVPLTLLFVFTDGSSRRESVLMDRSTMELALPESIREVKLNVEQAGFYRVAYSRQMLERLCALAAEKLLSGRDRYSLLYDMHARVVRGDLAVQVYLSLLGEYFCDEADFLPAVQISRSLRELHRASDTAAGEIARVGRTVLQPAIDRVGVLPREGERHVDALLRESLLWSSYIFDHEETKHTLQPAAYALVEHGDSSQVDANMRPLLYRIAAAGHPHAFALLRTRFESPDIAEGESQEILSAVGMLSDQNSYMEMLDYVVDQVPARNQFIALTSAAANPLSRGALWEWFTRRVEALERLHRFHFLNIVVAAVSADGRGRLPELQNFFESYRQAHPDMSEETVDMALELAEVNEQLEHNLSNLNRA